MKLKGMTYEEGIGNILWWDDENGSTRATVLSDTYKDALTEIIEARNILEGKK